MRTRVRCNHAGDEEVIRFATDEFGTPIDLWWTVHDYAGIRGRTRLNISPHVYIDKQTARELVERLWSWIHNDTLALTDEERKAVR